MLSPYYVRLRSEIERFGGTVEKFIGDAVMAVFGAPVTHEDDPERAVRAALAARDAVQELNEANPALDLHVRIAVNTGEAVVALDARPSGGEGMVAGDVVNTAARLQRPRRWTASSSARRPTGLPSDRRVSRLRTGARRRGRPEPIPVWEALGARARYGVDVAQRGGAALVGRAPRSSTCSSRPRASLTRADATARHARRRPGHRQEPARLGARPGGGRRSRPDRLLAPGTLAPLRRRRGLLGGGGDRQGAGGDPRDRLRGDRRDQAHRDRVGSRPRRERGANWIESTAAAPRRGECGGGGRRATDATRRSRRGGASSRHSPSAVLLVLVFEDLHWADDNLLDFVDYLVDWVRDSPLLVLGTARPELLERRPGWGGGKSNAATTSLSPLSEEETARLLSSLLEETVMPAEIQALLLSRAGGNPLYAEEYARMVSERGVALTDAAPLPETVQGIVAARLDALSAEEKTLIQDAAVIGKVFWSGRARRDERARSVGRWRSSCTGSSERSSCDASGARRWRRRPSTRSATSSFATSPMDRSRAQLARRSIAARPSGSRRSAPTARTARRCSPTTTRARSSSPGLPASRWTRSPTGRESLSSRRASARTGSPPTRARPASTEMPSSSGLPASPDRGMTSVPLREVVDLSDSAVDALPLLEEARRPAPGRR